MAVSWFAVLMMALLGAIGRPLEATPGQRRSDEIGARLVAVLAAEESRAATAEQMRDLADATRAESPRVQAAAARALGRLERRDVVPLLLPLLSVKDADVRSEAANAVAQAFRGRPLADAPSVQRLEGVLTALVAAPPADGLYRAIGRLPYETLEQLRTAEGFLRAALDLAQPPASAVRGLESLARLHRKLGSLEGATVERLRWIVGAREKEAQPAHVRRSAMLALVAAQGADARTVEAALTDEEFEVRRLAASAAAGAGSALTAEQRVQFLRTALGDRSPQVRLEAVRSWARRAADQGCSALVDAIRDPAPHVALAAFDALGDHCKEDEQVTGLLAKAIRTPVNPDLWQRRAHALVALAKRSPAQAAAAMPDFAAHDDWQVRLYAARAAAAMNDVETLRRLATDPDDTVVEEALPPLRKGLGARSDPLFIAALNRRTRTAGRATPARPYQVFRAAAMALEGAESTPALLAALTGALHRASEERCDTSRDARLALIARIAELGSRAQEPVLAPLSKDIDPQVADAAASAIGTWTGRRPEVSPEQRRPDLPPLDVRLDDPIVTVQMAGRGLFRMAFYSEQAPLARWRFIRLVRDRYYDGLTFHRVVPNFVIQGGSPNANEYCGDCSFMRDEVGLTMNLRGTVGVSTRGRDTGDAQIFVNLVDNSRLDHDYTVFAYVCPGDLAVVDAIQEGDRMQRVSIGPRGALECPPPR